jgi:hypothetical protein
MAGLIFLPQRIMKGLRSCLSLFFSLGLFQFFRKETAAQDFFEKLEQFSGRYNARFPPYDWPCSSSGRHLNEFIYFQA